MTAKLQKRPVAWIITLVAVVLGSLLGGRASLLHLRGEAAAVFYGNDAESAYLSIGYDLGEIIADSHNLVSVAARYVDEGDALTGQVEQAIERLEGAVSPAAKHAAAAQLQGALGDLDEVLWTLDLSDTDRTYHRRLTANIDSRWTTIGNNGYNQVAADFNSELRRQPAGTIAAITGVRQLELYE